MDIPPRVTKIKTKINKWDLVKLKSICTSKETINKTVNFKNKYKKIQPTEWEKILTNNATHKGLIPKYTIFQYIQYIAYSAQYQKTNNPIKKWAEDLNRLFSKEDIQIANRHMRKRPTLLIIKPQNHNEVPCHSSQNGHQQKSTNNK